jgi:hypothetical protein
MMKFFIPRLVDSFKSVTLYFASPAQKELIAT